MDKHVSSTTETKNISLTIEIDKEFTGIMCGSPDESSGCRLKGRVILQTKKAIHIKRLSLVFLGEAHVTCGPPMAKRPEYSELQLIYRKVCHFFDPETEKPHQIPIGSHEFEFDFFLPGYLPSSFNGNRGKIVYNCHMTLNRPIFRKDITVKVPIILKRCLIHELAPPESFRALSEGFLDNSIQYQINAPTIAFCDGMVNAELMLKLVNSNVMLESIELGLKESVIYQTTGEASPIAVVARVTEESYPLGKEVISIDPLTDINRIPISFRLDPRVNCDVDSQLIELCHNIILTIGITERTRHPPFYTITRHPQYQEEGSTEEQRQTALDALEGRNVHYSSSQCENQMTPSMLSQSNTTRNQRRRTFAFPSARLSATFRTLSLSLPIMHHEPEPERQIRYLTLELPLIITSKSPNNTSLRLPQTITDDPPSYGYAMMIPSPPEYVPS